MPWRSTNRPASTASPTRTSSTRSIIALAIEDAGEDPDRWLVLGPDIAGNLLEVVVVITVDGMQTAIHAMTMRSRYRRLLER
jgi:hypothetical protein